MKKMQHMLVRFGQDEDGATAIEYGLIAALMAVSVIAAFTALGNGIVNLFGDVDSGAGSVISSAANSADL